MSAAAWLKWRRLPAPCLWGGHCVQCRRYHSSTALWGALRHSWADERGVYFRERVSKCVSGVCASPIALSGNTRAARSVVWLIFSVLCGEMENHYTKTADSGRHNLSSIFTTGDQRDSFSFLKRHTDERHTKNVKSEHTSDAKASACGNRSGERREPHEQRSKERVGSDTVGHASGRMAMGACMPPKPKGKREKRRG